MAFENCSPKSWQSRVTKKYQSKFGTHIDGLTPTNMRAGLTLSKVKHHQRLRALCTRTSSFSPCRYSTVLRTQQTILSHSRPLMTSWLKQRCMYSCISLSLVDNHHNKPLIDWKSLPKGSQYVL